MLPTPSDVGNVPQGPGDSGSPSIPRRVGVGGLQFCARDRPASVPALTTTASMLLAPKAPKQNFGCQPPTLEGEEGGGGPGGGYPQGFF